jgi:hypothetical protein
LGSENGALKKSPKTKLMTLYLKHIDDVLDFFIFGDLNKITAILIYNIPIKALFSYNIGAGSLKK